MARDIGRLDGEKAIANFADWTDRIAKGELPFDKPARPQGIEADRPMSLHWKLEVPLPMESFRAFSVLRA